MKIHFFQGVPVTELVYIHSKLMIADDKVTKILCSVEKNSEEQKPEIFLFVHFCFFLQFLQRHGNGKHYLVLLSLLFQRETAAICKVILSGSTAVKVSIASIFLFKANFHRCQYQRNQTKENPLSKSLTKL